MRILRHRLLVAAFASVVLGSGANLRAQEPNAEAARLQQLLRELGATSPAAWQARLQALEQEARAAEQRAQALRAEAAQLTERAKAADAEAKQRREAMQKLTALEQAVRALPAADDSPAAKAPLAKEPLAKAPLAKEPLAKEPLAKEPAAKEPAAKEPAANTPAPHTPAPHTPAAAMPPPTPKAAVPAPNANAPAAATKDDKDRKEAKDAALPTTFVDWAAVEPLLQDRCSSCHEPNDKKGGLDVTTFAAMRAGGGSGKTITPGEPEQSRLYLMVTMQERPFMPKGEDPLPAEQQQLLRTWIEQGASETVAAARAFVGSRLAAASAATGEDLAAAAPGPMPHELPAVALARPERAGAVKALQRSPNAPLLAMPGLQQVLLFDGAMQPLGVLPIAESAVEQIAFASDGTQLVAAVGETGHLGAAALFDVRSGRRLGTFGKERDVPLAVAAHAGAGVVALGGAGKRTVLLRQADGSLLASGAHDDFVLALAFAPDGTVVAAGDRAGDVKLWESGGGGLLESFAAHRGAVHAVAFAHNGQRLFTAGADGTVRAFDPNSGKEVWKQQAHDSQALALAVGPDGRLASCGSDGRIVVLDAGGKVVGKSPNAGEWLYAVAFDGEGKRVLAGDWQGRLHTFVLGSKDKTMPVTTPLAPR
ncbi:MAG: c-type cytochrome domain-containing protein [Planctomycetota bacterium]